MATLKAIKRDKCGTRHVRRLRKQGMVPGIIYGHGEAPLAVAVNEHELGIAIHHGERLLELDIEGAGRENVLVKEVQYDHIQKDVLHVDLARVRLDERVEVTVPIVLRGTPAGAADGGVLAQVVSEVAIDCLVVAIPEEVRVPISAMKIGDVLHMKDLPLPEGVKLVSAPELIVASVAVIVEEAAPVEGAEAAAAEPELVRERKPAEEETAEEEKKK